MTDYLGADITDEVLDQLAAGNTEGTTVADTEISAWVPINVKFP